MITREVTELDELTALTDDSVVLWAAQGLERGGRAWAGEDAVFAAAPSISMRDRLAVSARSPEAAVALAREVLPQLPRAFRPFGERALVEAIVADTPGLEVVAPFGWMEAREVAAPDAPAEWLPDSADVAEEISALLDRAYPTSYARPGVPGVTHWAGLRDDAGRLRAVGALAWPSPQAVLISGVVVDPEARGKGLALPVCATLAQAALAAHPTVALMVEERNTAARRLYTRLGLTYRSVVAAAFS